jgi:transglutaminase-like putative cysteine protease
MKLTIRHRTTYRYARPVVLQPHRMILRPRSSHDVVVLASSLVCCPDAQLDWTQDVFGNLIATGTFEGPTSELVISSNLIVEQLAEAWPVFGIAPEAHSFPFQYSRDDLADLGALNIPEHDDPEGRLDAWAHAFVRGATTDTLSLLKDLNAGVLGPVAYRVRDEEGTQTPLETLAQGPGKGDCQMRLAGSGAADEHGVALVGDEGAVGKVPDQHLIDRRAVEVELINVLGDRQLGDGELVFDGAGLLLGDLGR